MRSEYPQCPRCSAGRMVPMLMGPALCDLACERALSIDDTQPMAAMRTLRATLQVWAGSDKGVLGFSSVLPSRIQCGQTLVLAWTRRSGARVEREVTTWGYCGVATCDVELPKPAVTSTTIEVEVTL